MKNIATAKLISRTLMLTAFGAVSLGNTAFAGYYSGENSIKAAFVYNIAKLTTWPSADGPLVIGVIGSSGAGDTITDVVNGKDAGGRKIEVKSISASAAKSCQIVFVCGSGSAPSVSGPVLTVGEGSGFAKGGGAVGLVVDDGKVRMELNMGVVKKAGLKMSDKLTAIAKAVD